MAKKIIKKEHKISEKKIQTVRDLIKLIDSKNTIIIASTFNLLSSQLQEIRKKLRGKAEAIFVKKNIALRALEGSKKEGIKELVKYVHESPALIITDEDPFEIATLLSENRYPSRARPGQTAKKDIIIEAGQTDLMPGPILTELGDAGLKTGITGGKVTIKERKVLQKEGEKIQKSTSGILMKLEIMPFVVELEPLVAYDSLSKKVYSGLKIDKEETINKLKEAFSSALQFGVKIGYPSDETIKEILINAEKESIALNNLTVNTQTITEEN